MSRGGKRKNSGRKPVHPDLFKTPVSYKLPGYVKDWLSDQRAATGVSSAKLIELGLLCMSPDLCARRAAIMRKIK